MSLAEIFPQLLAQDNAARQNAEAHLQQLSAVPSTFLPGLLEVARTHDQQQFRQMAAVLLRRNVNPDSWAKTSPEAQTAVKTGLLEGLSNESVALVRRAFADATSKLAAVVCAGGAWNELLPFVFNLCVAEDAGRKQSGLELLSALGEEVGESLAIPALEPMLPMLQQSLAPPSALPVRVAALRAVGTLVPHVQGKEHKALNASAQGLLPGMFDVLQSALSARADDPTRAALSALIDLAAACGAFFRPHADTLVAAALAVSSAEAMDEQVRGLALELLVSFTEARPALARKVPQLAERSVPVMLALAAAVEDEDEWHKNVGDEEDKDEDAETVDTGVEAMERFLLAVGGNRAVPATLPILAARVAAPQWQQRYAALRGLATLVATADKALKEHVPSLVTTAVRHLADDHPYVAWAAAAALAALCTCFAPDVQTSQHAEIMPALLTLLGPDAHPRLRSRAARLVVDFASECGEDEAEMLAAYADGLLGALVAMLGSGVQPQQQAAVIAVSALATALEERFLKYYASLIPGLVQLLQAAAGAGTPQGRILAGHAMECISCIADAVGTEHFAADAPAVMELLMALHAQQLSGDDSQMGTLLKASARIAKCMKGAFAPFLTRLLPSVMEYAQLDPKLSMEQADGAEEDGDGDGEYSIVNMKGVGKMRVSINIKELQDKALGCSMLAEWAEALQEHFLPHVEAAAQVLVPCCTYKLSEDVRAAAVDAMPELLRAVKAGGDGAMLNGLWSAAWMELAKASVVEPDPDAQRAILESIAACVEVCGDGCLTTPQQEQLCGGMLRPLVEEQATGTAKEEDEEEDEEEEGVMMAVVELLTAALKTHRDGIVQQIQLHLLPFYGQLLAADRPAGDKTAALCVLVELVDHGGAAALPLLPNIVAACLQYAQDGAPHVRRAACYGLAVCAARGGDAFAPQAHAALAQLHAVVAAPGAREGEAEAATDNAIDAVGRICKHHAGAVDATQVLPVWLSWLPLAADEECAQGAHTMLAELAEARHAAVVGQAAKAREVAAAVQAQGADFAPAELKARLAAAVAVLA